MFDYQTGNCSAAPIIQRVLLLLFLLSLMHGAEAVRDISPQRECAVCHVMWLVDFNRKDVTPLIPYNPTPVVDTGKQDVVSTERMCFSCHDGFVLDSRFAWKNRQNFHPTGVKPSEKVSIPTIDGKQMFPLNKDGKMYCGTCHSAHGVEWGEKLSPLFLRMKNIDSSLCIGCHLDHATGPEEGNHPVFKQLNEIPHKLAEAGSKFGSGDVIICQTCHRVHGAPEKKLLAVKNSNSELCSTCHTQQRRVADSKHNMALVDAADKNVRGREVGQAGVCSACHLPHGGQGMRMWARPLKQGADPVAELCFTCHSEGKLAKNKQVGEHSHPLGRDMARLDGAVDLPGYTTEGVKSTGDSKGRISCPTCHNPHQWDPLDPEKTSKPGDSGNGKFLRKPYGPEAELCLTCHKNKAPVANTKHDLAVMAPAERNIKGQTSAEKGVCASCHLPHNGKGVRMWAREPLAGVDLISSACLSCHNPKGVAKKKSIGANSHPLDVPIANIGILAKDGQWSASAPSAVQPAKALPLYDTNGVQTEEGGNVACSTCHDPHNWSPSSTGKPSGDPRQSKGAGDNSFLRLPNDNKGTLCANCHLDKGAVALSKHNLDISAPEAKNSKGRNTAESGVCGTCHLPHNGNGAKMWARGTAPGQDGIEMLCKECHRDGGVAEKKQTGAYSHPLRVDLKNIGGTTTLPLYNIDGKKDAVSGMVACATCHNLHQWDSADAASVTGAKAEIEGNADNSFLRQPAGSSPQLCANCHQNKKQVKNTDHDMAVTAPDAKNILGQNSRESGVCGQCHLVHNAADKLRLWARPLGEGNDAMERLCRSCHAADKVAAAKMPVKANHPAKVTVVSTPGSQRKNGGTFPVFTSEGERSASGKISCPTCHNAHQWNALKAEEGVGRNVEGDSRSSFLRNSSDFMLCADCHGMDALFRYKYFHGEISRKK